MPEPKSDPPAKPRFLARAEEDARQVTRQVKALRSTALAAEGAPVGDVRAEDILAQDEALLLASDYPSPACLQPDQIERLVLDGATSLGADASVQAHLLACRDCASLVEAAAPNAAEWERIRSELGGLAAPPRRAGESPTPPNQPTQPPSGDPSPN